MVLSSPLWIPSEERRAKTLLTEFQYRFGFKNYQNLYDFSITEPENFWCHVWDFCSVIASSQGDIILNNKEDLLKAQFFPQAHLNYAENLLRRRDNENAILFYDERGTKRRLTFKELYSNVSQVVSFLKAEGIQKGDRIAAYMPNLPETIIAMLATASIGAIWSSCSPDFGVEALIDRFSQIEPKLLLVSDGYVYAGKKINCLERIDNITKKISSIQNVIIVPYIGLSIKRNILYWEEILNQYTPQEIEFEQFPFSHPLFILYSSGTTGLPKCIVHSAGGTLLQHLKEHQLHCNIQKNDRVFYYTTCGWMMWNWLASALASEATLILYEGAPLFPKIDALWEIAEDARMTLFGTSAKYLSVLAKENFIPPYSLKSLKTITSTGSPLSSEAFRYVYKGIKKDLHLASISGGTDIISCFVLGNPNAPVWEGQLQTPGLGMKVEVFNAQGEALSVGKGELVCSLPFPSQPLGFWKDKNHTLYKKAYFERFKNVWHHGDFIEKTKEGGIIMLGRSDATLNPSGVRIGTAEIYRQIEKLPEVRESLVIGQKNGDDEQILLFLILREKIILTSALEAYIRNHIRDNTTPRHVPKKIIQAYDFPRTKNGKLAELVVKNIINNIPVLNQQSLQNPESLDFFYALCNK